MSLSLFKSIIKQMKGRTESLVIVGLGEPLLHPDIFKMIRFAKESGIEVSLIDNFTLMDEAKSREIVQSGLDFLYVSFDNVSKEAFEERRTGAVFEKVVSNIKGFLRIRTELESSTPMFMFKSTISNKNFTEIPRLIKFAEDIGADGINFGKMMDEDESRIVKPPPFKETDLPESKIAIFPCELSEDYECDTTRGCYVTYDGKVLPCGLMGESVSRAHYPEVTLGDLKSNTLGSIWRSEKFRKLRKDIAQGEYLPECRTCGGYRGPSQKS
jgi:radical SAM protein with 4Fe4S-binding SPASM domain